MPGTAKRNHLLSVIVQTHLIFVFLFFCPLLWAAQDAIVIADKAVIYADKKMTSPIGFVTKGKRVTVGEVPRNRAQLYPIVVSGRLAYIRVIDVSTEMMGLDTNTLVAERFLKATTKRIENHYAFSFFSYPTQINMNHTFGGLSSNDAFTWTGIQLKGSIRTSPGWDMGVVVDYAEGKEGIETFRMFEVGGDISYRIYTGKNFIFRWQNQALAVPFSSYALGTATRVNGYGFTLGSGLNANWIFNDNFGLEIFGGLYTTRLFGFDLPDPRNTSAKKYPPVTLNPSFTGSRVGVGMTYQY
jgi:hypothetical protein